MKAIMSPPYATGWKHLFYSVNVNHILKCHQPFKIYSADTTVCLTLNLKRPWSNMHSAHCLMVLYICAKSFQNFTNPSRVIERTHHTVIQCLTLNYDLALELTLVKQRGCIDSSYLTFVQSYLQIPPGVQKIKTKYS